MKMKIDVKDEKEAQLIKLALADEQTRALVIVIGIMLQLDTNRARARVLNFVADSLDEMNADT